MVVVYIGLGSNLAQPVQQIQSALVELHDIPQSRFLGCSSLYRSAPLVSQESVSPESASADQPDYINAVAALETDLDPLDLLTALQAVENAHGRVRESHWGPRTLDLDLLLYGDRVMNHERLTLPHPGLYDRNFVLYPLHELVSEHGMAISIPGEQDLAALLAQCPATELEKLTS